MKGELKHLFYSFIRWALTGKSDGPSVKGMIDAIGLDETFKRIDSALEYLEKHNMDFTGESE